MPAHTRSLRLFYGLCALFALVLAARIVFNLQQRNSAEGRMRAQQELNRQLLLAVDTFHANDLGRLIKAGANPHMTVAMALPNAAKGDSALLYFAWRRSQTRMGVGLRRNPMQGGVARMLLMTIGVANIRNDVPLEKPAALMIAMDNGMMREFDALLTSMTPNELIEPLQEAVSLRKKQAAQKILAKGVKPIFAKKGEFTLLMYAAGMEGGGQAEMIDPLIEAGEDVNAQTATGETPLMFAVMSGNEACVRAMLAHRPKIDSVNRAGRTALHIAKQYKFVEAERLLIAAGAKNLPLPKNTLQVKGSL